MKPDIWTGAFLSAATLALTLLVSAGTARADGPYHLLAGDVVAMSVAGVPDLTQKAEVQLDGSLSLPMVGEVPAAGQTLAEVRDSIRTAVASRLVPVYTSDGQEHLRTVTRDQVSVWIADYRPIFVSGDVTRPGEFSFRPGLTARQAIAAAGGMMAEPISASAVNTAGLQSDYIGAWYALASSEARIWRLQTELGAQIAFDASGLPPVPQANTALAEILHVEKELRTTRDLDNERQRAFLKRAVDQIGQQTAVLQRELEVQKKSESADAADLEKAVKLMGKGLFTESRMSDLRRAALTSATMRLQTEANLMQLERRSTEIGRELEQLADKRHLELLDELQRTQAKRAADEAKLSSLAAQMQAAGVAAPYAEADGKPVITVVHAGTAEPIVASPDLALRPGDIVQVSRKEAGAGPAIGTRRSQDQSSQIGQTSGKERPRATASRG